MTSGSSPEHTPAGRPAGPPLRLLHGDGRPGEGCARPTEPPLHAVDDVCRVLVADADPAMRATILDELAHSMPSGTAFAEARTLAELLELAPRCELVILGGALDVCSPAAVARILAERHPDLAVVGVGVPGPALP